MKEQAVGDIAARIVRDRTRWLNRAMKQLLPNRIYCAARNPAKHEEVSEYMKKEEISLVHGDTWLEIHVKGKPIARWSAQFSFRPPPTSIIRLPEKKIIITDK